MSSSSDSATVLMITPRLTSRLVQALATRLLQNASPALHVLAPVDADAGVRVPHALRAPIASGTLRLHYGTPGSGALVRALLQENKIHTVYLVCELDADADACAPMTHASPAARARTHLQPLCALLECVRDVPELTLVPVFHVNDADVKLIREDGAPTVRCASEASVRFSGTHALLHAYAVSYRLNVQIALLQGALHAEGELQRALDFVQAVACKRSGKAPIHAFKSDGQAPQQPKEEDTISYAARLLLFGAPTVVESARAALAAEYAHAQITVARTHPGQDADEAVQAECQHASHLVYVQGADEPTQRAWEAGGASNLLYNVRHNLFAPWLLAHIARRGAQRFWRVDACGQRQGEEEQYDQQNGAAAELASSRYEAVRHFADRLCRMEMDATM